MKHRILQFSDDTFILQEKKFLFWCNISNKYGNFYYSYDSLNDAKMKLEEHLKELYDIKVRKEQERYRQNNVKIHNI